MKVVPKYIFLLLVLLSVLFNIADKSGKVYPKIAAIHATSDQNDDGQFFSQDICPIDIFSRETNTAVPSNNFRLTTNSNVLVCESINHIGIKMPKVYRDVIMFDIDNLATLGRNQIFILRKLRI